MSLPGGLDFTTMGYFGLFVFWLNVGLVILSAIRDALKVQRRLRMAKGRVHRARIAGASGPVARHVIEQVGRSPQDGDAIHFHDRRHRSELLGGTVDIEGTDVELAPSDDVEIWVFPEALRPSVEPSFDEALAAAKRARGFEREMAYELGANDTLWLIGSIEDGRLAPAPELPLVLSTVDPLPWLRARLRLTALMVGGWLLGALATTALAAYPPVFGTVSAVGAVSMVVFFLGGLLPWGVWLRERVSPPGRWSVRGRWDRPALSAAAAG